MSTILNATTKLSAVNTMLFTIGESPVNTLEGGKSVDVVTAEQTLDAVTREVQSDGWAFNHEKAFPLKRAAFDPKEIAVPPTALHCDPSDTSLPFVVRGSRLYDNANHTFLFPDNDTVECDIIWLLPFDDMPETCRRYVTIRAARIFQDGRVGSDTLHAFSAQDEQTARWRHKKHNARVRDKNILTGSVSVARILAR